MRWAVLVGCALAAPPVFLKAQNKLCEFQEYQSPPADQGNQRHI